LQVNQEYTVIAYFLKITYGLTYRAMANGSISGAADQTVEYGASGSPVTAVPDSGYFFVNWSDGRTDNPRTDTNVTHSVIVNALFAAKTYTLKYSAQEHGSISGSKLQTVEYGKSGSAVTAVADAHYHFYNWSDFIQANPRTDTNVKQNIDVSANFVIDSFLVKYLAGNHGSIGGSGSPQQAVDYGDSSTEVTAIGDYGYHFVSWSDGRTDNPRSDTNVTKDITVTATFAINAYTLSYTAGEHGTISGNALQTVEHGKNGTAVTAVPDSGYRFVNWNDGSTANPRTDQNVTDNVSVTASFAPGQYTLTYNAGSYGRITGNSHQTVNGFSSGQAVTAVADVGYHFTNWSDGSLDNPRTDTNVTADITVTAYFAINIYSLVYWAGLHGSVSGMTPQMVEHGKNGSAVSAVPDPGYKFVSWNDGRNDNPRTDTNVTASVSVIAFFALNTCTLTYKTGSHGSISGESSQTVNYGGDGTPVTALPDKGYHFVSWDDGSTANPRTDTNVTANITVTANFAINTYVIVATAGANGTIAPAGTFTLNYGASKTFTIKADNAYRIADVLVDGVSVGAVSTYTFADIGANHTISASFTEDGYTITATAGTGGSIAPAGTVKVTSGGSQTFTISAETGYHIETVTVDGSSIGAKSSYTFKNVMADHTISAGFQLDPPTLTWVVPVSGARGATLKDVVIAGTNLQGASSVSFGAGITVGPIIANIGTGITLDIQIDKGAEAGNRTITVTTPGGAATLKNGFKVTAAATDTTVTSSANPVDYGQPLVFTAVVASIAGIPEGTIQFKADGKNLGGKVGLVNGSAASPAVTDLVKGNHAITAVYSGSPDFLASTSPELIQTINLSVPEITTTTLSQTEGEEKIVYPAQDLAVTGGAAPYKWSVFENKLPAGMTLKSKGDGRTAVLSGKPSKNGEYSFTLRATDKFKQTDDQAFTLFIYKAPSVYTTSLPAAEAGKAYNEVLKAQDGHGAFTWSKLTGSWPPGINLDSTGTISGTPDDSIAKLTSYKVTVQAQDEMGGTAKSKSLTLVVALPLVITTESPLQAGEVGLKYSQALKASGGSGKYTWKLADGSYLPDGLKMSSKGVISGKPAAAGIFTFQVELNDGSISLDKQFSLTVFEQLKINTLKLPGGEKDQPYPPVQLAAVGGDSEYTWTVTGNLPPGLVLDKETGIISGTPSKTGKFSFSVKATDGLNASATSKLSIVIE
jgi:hypothetical protein